MHLLDLPTELLRAILEETVIQLGLRRSFRARLVCKRFAIEIANATISTRLIDRASSLAPGRSLDSSVISRMLFYRAFVDDQGESDNHVLKALRKTAEEITALCQSSGIASTSDRLSHKKATCDCMARVWGQNVFDLLAGSKAPPFEPPPQSQQRDRWSVLSMAAYIGTPSFPSLLTRDLGNPASDSWYFSDPLSTAAMQGDAVIVQALLEAGADIDKSYAMLEATRVGNASLVELFLSRKPSPAAKTIQDAIHDSIVYNRLSIFKLLLSHAPTFSPSSYFFRECLLSAVRRGSVSTVSHLLTTYSDELSNSSFRTCRPDPPQQDLLQLASQCGHTEVVSFLLSRTDADPFYGSLNNKDALNLAASRGHTSVMRLLLDAGADPHGFNIEGNYGPLTDAARSGQPAAIRLLFARGFDLEGHQYQAEQAMLGACQYGWGCVVRTLADLGVPADRGCGWYEREDDRWPMLTAMIHSRQNAVEALRTLGARHIDPLETVAAEQFRKGVFPLLASDW